MMTKTVYQTDSLGIYTCTTQADTSPLEPDVWLIPGGCVEVAPPEVPEHKAALWNGQAWQLVDYYQGLIVYNITTGEPLTLNGMEPIPAGYTLLQPGPEQVWKKGEWVDDTAAILGRLYQEKLAEVTQGCAQYIESGFVSHALGEPYHYPSSLEDQVNLTGLMFSGLDGAFPCTDADGVRQFLMHTAEKLHLVNQDLVRFKQGALQHADQLKRALEQALKDKKLRAMQAIKWTAPE
nr:hypothetical protein [uncultured Pseudomonas sp.]